MILPTASVPLSILDLSFVREGEGAREALLDSRTLAQAAERLGYKRFWMAEHHNMEGIASAATSVALAFVAGGTNSIRIGSGGIMLPNHSPLVIAEQFGTLEALFPGRIDLGIGRAPGGDMKTARALRRHLSQEGGDTFPQDVMELIAYFAQPDERQAVNAHPGQGLEVPIWLLGSSLYSAQLAAYLGLPFAFASHFAPEHLFDALAIYRAEFRPSEHLSKPYAAAAINVVVADSDEEAEFLFSSAKLGVYNMLRGRRLKMQPPCKNVDADWSPEEKLGVQSFLKYAFVGSPNSVRRHLEVFQKHTEVNEVIVSSRIFDLDARLRSLELLAEVWSEAPIAV